MKCQAEEQEQKSARHMLDELVTKYELSRDGAWIHWRAASKVGNTAEFLAAIGGSQEQTRKQIARASLNLSLTVLP